MDNLPDEESPSLVEDDLSFESIVNNPILKPIAECDRSLKDFDSMILKKMRDNKSGDSYVEQSLKEIPVYSDSPFISRLINLYKGTADVIKMQDIQIRLLRKTIREMVSLVKSDYGVRVKETEYKVVPDRADIPLSVETPLPDNIYQSKEQEDYLNLLKESGDEVIKELAGKIFEKYLAESNIADCLKRFKTACILTYKDEEDKDKKKIIVQIMDKKIGVQNE